MKTLTEKQYNAFKHFVEKKVSAEVEDNDLTVVNHDGYQTRYSWAINIPEEPYEETTTCFVECSNTKDEPLSPYAHNGWCFDERFDVNLKTGRLEFTDTWRNVYDLGDADNPKAYENTPCDANCIWNGWEELVPEGLEHIYA